MTKHENQNIRTIRQPVRELVYGADELLRFFRELLADIERGDLVSAAASVKNAMQKITKP